MKRHVGFTLCALTLISLTAIYLISCLNAGRALSWESFTNGLLVRSSNCGGNSYARTRCQNIALSARVAAGDSGDIFDFTKLSEQQRMELAYADDFWTPDAKYLLDGGPMKMGPGTHELLVVCDTPYGNVPQPTFWNLHRSTLRHAAGYSDGSVGWLTESQFAELKKSNFVELKFKTSSVDNGTNAVSFQ